MYGSPADARRQPSPQAARHGEGRPPDGQPGVVRVIARTALTLFGWSQDQPGALPPLSPSSERSPVGDGPSVGAVQRQPVDIQDLAQSNEFLSCRAAPLGYCILQTVSYGT